MARPGEIAGLVVHTVPYLEQVKNAGGERLGSVMMRAGMSYSLPVSRLREWLQQNHIPFSTKQLHRRSTGPAALPISCVHHHRASFASDGGGPAPRSRSPGFSHSPL